MPADRARHRSKTDQFDIVVVPVGQGGQSKSYRLTKLKLWLGASGLFIVIVALMLAALLFTPLLSLIPIPSTVFEQRYGRQLLETQKELRALGEEMVAMRAYNDQLRKVLGVGSVDSAAVERVQELPLLSSPAPVESGSLSESTLVAEYGEYAGDIAPFTPPVSAQPVYRVSLPMVAPVSGVMTQKFTPGIGHFGIDYASRPGTPVFSAADGFVIFSGWTYDDGNMLMISHADGFITVYKHNQSLLKVHNTPVTRGEVIAFVGSSGNTSKGPHLHFEMWKDGLPVDPEQFLLVNSQSPVIF